MAVNQQQLPPDGQMLRYCREAAHKTPTDLSECILTPVAQPFDIPLRNLPPPLAQLLPPAASLVDRMAIVIERYEATNKWPLSRDLLPEFLNRCVNCFMSWNVDKESLATLAHLIGIYLLGPQDPPDS